MVQYLWFSFVAYLLCPAAGSMQMQPFFASDWNVNYLAKMLPPHNRPLGYHKSQMVRVIQIVILFGANTVLHASFKMR